MFLLMAVLCFMTGMVAAIIFIDFYAAHKLYFKATQVRLKLQQHLPAVKI